MPQRASVRPAASFRLRPGPKAPGVGVAGQSAAHLLTGPATTAAPALIGWRMVMGGQVAEITETEAYQGVEDRACHASKGRTPRTATLFGPSGTLYIYLCYGIHHLLNLVCDGEGVPAAVLIRSVSIPGLDPRRTNGPGKVCAVLGLDRRQHGLHLDDSACPLALQPPEGGPARIRCGKRIGVGYAGAWSHRRWRWWREGFPVVPEPEY